MSELLGLTERILLYHAAALLASLPVRFGLGNPPCAWIGQV